MLYGTIFGKHPNYRSRHHALQRRTRTASEEIVATLKQRTVGVRKGAGSVSIRALPNGG